MTIEFIVPPTSQPQTVFHAVYTPNDIAELDDMTRIQVELWKAAAFMLPYHAHGRIAKSVVFGAIELHSFFNPDIARMSVTVEWQDDAR